MAAMSSNIVRHEFKTHRRSLAIWSLSAAVVILFYMSVFPSFVQDAALLDKTMESFPPELLTAFGLNGVDLATVMGFFTFVYLFVQILLAIQAANYGFGLVSVEERERTADFLLTRPVSRRAILTGKLLAALGSLAATQAVVWAASFLCINIFRGEHPYDADLLIRMLLGLPLFQMVFFAVGLVVSLLVRRIRSVTPYSLGLVFGLYVLAAFGDMLGESGIEALSPFKHFNPNYLVRHGHFETPLLWLSVAVVPIAIAASYRLYIRRDIPSVA